MAPKVKRSSRSTAKGAAAKKSSTAVAKSKPKSRPKTAGAAVRGAPPHSLGYVITYVDDVAVTLTWFHEVFGFAIGFQTPDASYGELTTGMTKLAFASEALAGANLPCGFVKARTSKLPLGMELGVVTSDVLGSFDRAISHGAKAVAAPKMKPWGQWVGYVRAPCGVLVELCSPMGG